MVKSNWKKKKEEHANLTWFDKLPIVKIPKRVFILTLRNENFKNTPEPSPNLLFAPQQI